MTEDSEAFIQRRIPRDIKHVLLLAGGDATAMFCAFLIAFLLRNQSPAVEHPLSSDHFAVIAAAMTPLWIALFAMSGLYSVKIPRSRLSEIGRCAGVVVIGDMTLIVLQFFGAVHGVIPGRSVPIVAFMIALALLAVERGMIRTALRLSWRRGRGLHNVVLIGSGPIARRIAKDLVRPNSGYRIIAAVSSDPAAYLPPATPVYDTLQAAMAGREHLVDEVLQADASLARAEVEQLMAFVTSIGKVYRFVPNQYGVYAASSTLGAVAGVPVMDVRLTALDGWGAVYKRTFDMTLTLVLLVVTSPLLLLIALCIKLGTPSAPVIYRQERLGRGGRPIRLLKFRTMQWQWSTGPGRPYPTPLAAFAAMGRPDLCEEFLRDHKVHDDPRISGLGRFLRRLSLDELPQLLNVLRGDLSLIGPRPITADELTRYGSQQISFLALKPGMTGLWQVSGRSLVSYEERVKMDIYYIENWSARLDLAILARTTTAVLAKRGAV